MSLLYARCYNVGNVLEPEKQEVLTQLDEGRKALSEALAGVDEQMAVWKQMPTTWSILECVEHVVVSEEFLLSRLMAARASASALPNSTRESMILERGIDRTTRVESPAVGRPRGRYLNLQDAFTSFSAVRARTIDWVGGLEGDLRSWLTDHPLIPGPVNGYEMLLIISVHPRRHAEQIKAIRISFEQAQKASESAP
ncbi:MAG: DinB family protein [Bryobacteraceae bacterium]|jgi:hypothetical protein